MRQRATDVALSIRSIGRTALSGPQILAFLPALSLAAFWLGGEKALLIVAVGVPALLAIGGAYGLADESGAADGANPSTTRDGIAKALDRVLARQAKTGQSTVCLSVTIDEFGELQKRFDANTVDFLLKRVGQRLEESCRDIDRIAHLERADFAIALSPIFRPDLEAMLQLSGRLQAAVAEPISIDSATTYVTVSVGFCLPGRLAEPTGAAMLEAAEVAMMDARRNGPNSIRAFAPEMVRQSSSRKDLDDEASRALAEGHIKPWFQPQISTDTGEVTGFEALARWIHPDRGTIPPSDFLSSLDSAGLMERLGEVMLFQSLTAMRCWDQAGHRVPSISVNFSDAELQNPNIVEKIRWELDRFDLAPDRLTVEILETVVSNGGNDTVTRNLAGLAELGCNIDLDDFGTGNTSIGHIRRFAVGRIKIDRSFVMKVDRDPDQQRMVAAILTMAERLELETLAEGVETTGEHAMLAQLGCGYVQGFGIARPMPFENTIAWIEHHSRKLSEAPRIGKTTG